MSVYRSWMRATCGRLERRIELTAFVVVVAFGLMLGVRALYQDRQPFEKHLPEGRMIVNAVYAFKKQRATWPKDLAELVPEFLRAEPD
jgi:hypothetical protein